MKSTAKASGRRGKAAKKFTPTAWQWDPESVSDAGAAPGFENRIQFWSAGGSMSIVSVARAKELVRVRAAFVGERHYICQVHDGIDGANA